jgi:hypothetical protein
MNLMARRTRSGVGAGVGEEGFDGLGLDVVDEELSTL